VGDCNPTECGRPGAAKIMIVMTDGLARASQSGCDGWALNGTINRVEDNPLTSSYADDAECAAQAAVDAAAENIVIYSITVGDGADQEVMKVVAEVTGGTHYHAVTSDQLDLIFDDLFKRIFLRLIS
jgi:hypothetical protein